MAMRPVRISRAKQSDSRLVSTEGIASVLRSLSRCFQLRQNILVAGPYRQGI